MKYMGSKAKVARYIVPIIQDSGKLPGYIEREEYAAVRANLDHILSGMPVM